MHDDVDGKLRSLAEGAGIVRIIPADDVMMVVHTPTSCRKRNDPPCGGSSD